jgi:malonate transporter
MSLITPKQVEAVITAAIPMITLIAILGVRYRLAETEAASAVFLSFVGSLVTIGLFIAVTGGQSLDAANGLRATR